MNSTSVCSPSLGTTSPNPPPPPFSQHPRSQQYYESQFQIEIVKRKSNDPAEIGSTDYLTQVAQLEEEHKRRLRAKQEMEMTGRGGRGLDSGENRAPREIEMQLRMLEEQNKMRRRGVRARESVDCNEEGVENQGMLVPSIESGSRGEGRVEEGEEHWEQRLPLR